MIKLLKFLKEELTWIIHKKFYQETLQNIRNLDTTLFQMISLLNYPEKGLTLKILSKVFRGS